MRRDGNAVKRIESQWIGYEVNRIAMEKQGRAWKSDVRQTNGNALE